MYIQYHRGIWPLLSILIALSGCIPEEFRPATGEETDPVKSTDRAKPVKTTATVKPKKALGTPKVKKARKPSKAKKPGEVKKSEQICQITLTAPRNTAAENYYVKGERFFNNNEVSKAKKALKTATCLNPEHKQAKELLELLQATYP
ncbi:hypothetical protein QUF61_00995 [Candidatus Venteria ishoeyi]|uniref:hypothetical protein n=1 Tax=Candidatus Venteria ishoeyi TaxID=1899563 RepID=UPI0025A51B06|nr:hypothetical protein [Candidatus Venteria ishoeyi]MDM8545048.1 hypothetical protein [Candidatus Venteria ishoeyi]